MSFRNLIKDHLRSGSTVLALALALTAGTAPMANADVGDQGLPGDWLSRYASPFAVGMGGATVAVGQEPQAALWNPAGLSWLRRNAVQATSTRLFDETTVNGLAFAMPSRNLPTFALNILYLKSGEFEQTNALNETLGTFSEGDLVMALSGAHQLSDRWSVGANVKMVRQTLEDFSGGGVGLDLGLMGEVIPGVKVAASALNLGGPTIALRDKDESYAQEYRGGVATELLEGNGLLTVEAVHRDGPGTEMRVGGQYLLGALSLRAGYFIENIAAGFGYRFENGLSLDYGMNDHELGMVHRFGLNYAFGGFYAGSMADPAVFSPMGSNPVTKFLLTAHTKGQVDQWQLAISDRSGEIVRSYAGQGQPPAQIIWDGKDRSGLPLPDGQYAYVLEVTERDGRTTSGRVQSVEISTGGPQGSTPVQ
ncbi:MAG: FlgD immunoglobulin-like domain containing protein [Candidatus Krumholzibacteria bacterium]|nr:FlgD immunoglobulin-like domain containing protein [Candidatus Krumholzibacteria bacterium]